MPPASAHHEALLAEFDAAAPALLALGEALRADLVAWLSAESAIKVHSLTVRLKTRDSLAAKLARPDRSYDALWDVTDLLGLRVITYFEDAVDQVAQLLEGRLAVALEHSVDRRRRRDATAFGYRSVHYVCRIDVPALSPRACFEVQVRTVLEHAWAEIEHDLGYKARDVVPVDARRRLSRLAGLLELADQEFVAIRGGLEAYARSLPDRVAAEGAGETVPLDALSLPVLLGCDEVRDLDAAIAQRLGRALGEEVFFPTYLLRMLLATGVRTVEGARAGVRRHAAPIEAMVTPYFAFASRAFRLSPDRMERLPRGYSLFFLAHAVLLEASTLRLDKVARLAQLYRELDYPDDPRAAQQVAGMLVDAFGDVQLGTVPPF